jgi:hypothetical protein
MHPAQDGRYAQLATRGPIHKFNELARRCLRAREMKHGGVAVCSGRELDEDARGVGHVDEFDRNVERPKP